ncbi:NlpC/P60 family protein [Streptomyces tateyamensis]|uniref:C40 family peptidase n=1 Tax=Streptomyces tateyamensis TaxID=565073 RepID=UPI0011B48341|nr:NlpC/P60 family protein [Streptomyces tateyamensis]
MFSFAALAGLFAGPGVPAAAAAPVPAPVAVRGVAPALALGRPAAVRALAPALGRPAAVPADDPAPDGRPYPSAAEVDRARAEADLKAGAAGAIEAQLAGAKSELERTALLAEQAVEAYDGAQVRLTAARGAAAAAAEAATRAEAARAEAAERAAGLAAATYRAGTTPELSALDALLSARGPRAASEQAAAVGEAGRSTRQILDAATSTAREAAEAARTSRDCADAAERAVLAVAQARSQAQQRVAEQQSQVGRLAERREQLFGQLAAARQTTVDLERRRQDALDAIAAEQAAAAARAAAERANAAPPQPAPSAGTGAEQALAFAQGKLGLPYIWGGEGPDGYDCSGLTMLAWRAGGKRLTHFAADQYAESTPVSYRQLRPGDLVFWSTTGRPADIHHVALYLGDDQIIQAPHTGATITRSSLWALGTPDFYARP